MPADNTGRLPGCMSQRCKLRFFTLSRRADGFRWLSLSMQPKLTTMSHSEFFTRTQFYSGPGQRHEGTLRITRVYSAGGWTS